MKFIDSLENLDEISVETTFFSNQPNFQKTNLSELSLDGII